MPAIVIKQALVDLLCTSDSDLTLLPLTISMMNVAKKAVQATCSTTDGEWLSNSPPLVCKSLLLSDKHGAQEGGKSLLFFKSLLASSLNDCHVESDIYHTHNPHQISSQQSTGLQNWHFILSEEFFSSCQILLNQVDIKEHIFFMSNNISLSSHLLVSYWTEIL